MKRMWAYFAALLPLTKMATSPAQAAVGQPSEDMSDNAISAKQQQPAEDEAEQSEDLSAHKTSAHHGADNAAGGAETSSSGSTSDSGGHGRSHGSGSGYGNSSSPAMSPTDGASSNAMSAPSSSSAGSAGYAPSGAAAGGSGGAGSAHGGEDAQQTTDQTDTTATVADNTDPAASTYSWPVASRYSWGEPPGSWGESRGPASGPDSGCALASDTGYVEPDPADADAMMILLGGGAVASGEDATTTGDVQLDIVDYGPITVGYGYATYMGEGSESAGADTFAVVEGADFVRIFEVDYSYGFEYGPYSEYADYSTTYVIAIDFEEGFWAGDAFASWGADYEDDIHIDGNLSELIFTLDVQGEDEPSSLVASTDVIGNLSSALSVDAQTEQGQLSIVAEALGVDTLISATGSITEIEDQFSSVTGAVVAVA